VSLGIELAYFFLKITKIKIKLYLTLLYLRILSIKGAIIKMELISWVFF